MCAKSLLKRAAVRPDLKDLFEEFIKEKEALNKADATISSYRFTFGKFYQFLEETEEYSTIAESMTVKIIYAFSMQLKKAGLKPCSINHHLREVRALCYWCMEEGYMPRFRIKLVKEEIPIKETYTDKELERLLVKPKKTASFTEWRTWTVENWVLATGNRAATICAVKLGDLDYEAREIHIRRTKNYNHQIIPMSRELFFALKEYIRMWRATASDKDSLFCSITGEPLTVNALKLSVKKYNLRREVKRSSIHAFRHTFAKKWIINTGDVFRLQKILGHKSLEMTRRYVNMFSDELKDHFDEYNPLDRIKSSSSRRKAVVRNDWCR